MKISDYDIIKNKGINIMLKKLFLPQVFKQKLKKFFKEWRCIDDETIRKPMVPFTLLDKLFIL
jgi:hypothetical protein